MLHFPSNTLFSGFYEREKLEAAQKDNTKKQNDQKDKVNFVCVNPVPLYFFPQILALQEAFTKQMQQSKGAAQGTPKQ